jgi:diguanylate cyclase (GGDEF)-like protein
VLPVRAALADARRSVVLMGHPIKKWSASRGRVHLRTAPERKQIADRRAPLSDGTERPLYELLGGGDAYLRAAAVLATAAAERAAAATDRQRGADDRAAAVGLRAAAARDRSEAVRERTLAGIDQLTGVSLRGVGLAQINREIQRARRTRRPLALVFVDVNNLKAMNDTEGHLAGDVLLSRVAEMLRTKLRPYDVIMRFGGDEFVCALTHIETEDVRGRFTNILETLEATEVTAPFSFGVADLRDDDDLESLLARADQDLIDTRHTSGHRSLRT